MALQKEAKEYLKSGLDGISNQRKRLNADLDEAIADDRKARTRSAYSLEGTFQTFRKYTLCLIEVRETKLIGRAYAAGLSVPNRQKAGGGKNVTDPDVRLTNNCVYMRQRSDSFGFWEVVNTCKVRVFGNFCYDNSVKIWNCADKNGGGGFGPIAVGGTEMVSGPGDTGSHIYRVYYCAYGSWLKGTCKARIPDSIRRR